MTRMSIEFLYGIPQAFLVAGVFLFLMCASELGFRAGRRRRMYAFKGEGSAMGALQSASLGLLALLLGFTFAMAASRHSERGEKAADECNAIGTAQLRSDFLPEAAAAESRSLWLTYAQGRLARTMTDDSASLGSIVADDDAVRTRIWNAAVKAAREEPLNAPRALYVGSVTEAFDASDRLDSALRRHVPEPVIMLLLLTGGVAACALGYGCGMADYRFSVSQISQFLIIALVIGIIVDLDHPVRGFIALDRSPLKLLIDSIQRR